MNFVLKDEYMNRLKSELSISDYDKYIKSLDEEEKHGMTINLHKLKISSINLDYIINRFKGTLIYRNDNFAYITYNKTELAKEKIFPGKDPLHHAGLYYIQEPCAAKVLYDVDIKKDDLILDLCASPGGKTAEVLFSLSKEEKGFIISNEIDFTRAKALLSNIERLGFDNVAVTCEDSQKLASSFNNYFDKVIVDAPCSGEGMFRKSENARLQWNIKLVKSLSTLQKKIVDDAYIMLREGGMLIYSTCTFSKDEDEEVVEYLLEKYNDLKLLKMEKNYPFNSIGEGQFFAILLKNDDMGSNGKHYFNVRDLKCINTLRFDVDKFEIKNKEKIPTHASTHIDDIKFENTLELNDDEIEKYLKGESIRVNLDFKGYCKVTYKNLGIGLAKYVDGVLKNHYPKGLRNL